MTAVEELRIDEVTPQNVTDACRLAVRPDQEQFVSPVAYSLAEAYVRPAVAWPRLVYRGDELVGFVMGGFDPGSAVWFFRAGVWRLNVAAGAQGTGVGRFAVETVLAEARRRGCPEATVLWVPGEGGPAGFYTRLGFVDTGERFAGQVVGRLTL
jgi:diamine N-acetyltransferase